MIIDLEKHGAKEFDEPLVVIDPVDPRRNVAAAVSLDRMVEFVEIARGYLDAPSDLFFAIPDEQTISAGKLKPCLNSAGRIFTRSRLQHLPTSRKSLFLS